MKQKFEVLNYCSQGMLNVHDIVIGAGHLMHSLCGTLTRSISRGTLQPVKFGKENQCTIITVC